MKKTLTLAILLVLCTSSFAQFKFGFGIKGGAYSMNAIKKVDNIESVAVNPFYGGFVHFKFGNTISIKPEILFFNNIYTETNDPESLKTFSSYDEDLNQTKYEQNYLVVPLMFQLNLGKGFSVEAGPQFHTVKKATSTNADGSVTKDNDISKSAYSDGALDFKGFAMGFNIHFSNSVHLNFRYVKNNQPSYLKYDSSNDSNNDSYKNDCLMVGLGISLFNTKEKVF